jgi:transporter family-2 protein
VLSGGLLQSVQMAFNGITARQLGRPEPLALFNYAFGSAGLLLVCLPELAAGGLARLPLAPGDWWYYTGGVLGSAVIIAGAMLTRTIGSLLFALGLVAGQLLGSLGVDLFWPASGARTGWPTAAGCVVTVLALVLASVPGLRGHSRRRSFGLAEEEAATTSSH